MPYLKLNKQSTLVNKIKSHNSKSKPLIQNLGWQYWTTKNQNTESEDSTRKKLDEKEWKGKKKHFLNRIWK